MPILTIIRSEFSTIRVVFYVDILFILKSKISILDLYESRDYKSNIAHLVAISSLANVDGAIKPKKKDSKTFGF